MGVLINPVVLEKGLRAEFNKALAAAEGMDHEQLMMKVSSSSDSEKYGWLGSVPQMIEFKDEKNVKGILDQSYTLANVPYEATIGIDRFSLEDDQLGASRVRIADLARRARNHSRKLLIDSLEANGNAYDGVAYFATTHAEGLSGTQSNLLTGTGVTVAALTLDFQAARAAMISFVDDQAEPMMEGGQNFVVLAGPSLLGNFEEVLTVGRNASGADNTLKGAARLVISSRLADANDWYLFDVSGQIKPMILQERSPIQFGSLEKQSESGFLSRYYKYGVEWRGAVGYGLWQKAIKTTNT